MVARGFKSKGIARMTSNGVADSALPVVQESLKKLHPPRAKRMLTMEELDTMGVPRLTPLDLNKTYGKLDISAGGGGPERVEESRAQGDGQPLV